MPLTLPRSLNQAIRPEDERFSPHRSTVRRVAAAGCARRSQVRHRCRILRLRPRGHHRSRSRRGSESGRVRSVSSPVGTPRWVTHPAPLRVDLISRMRTRQVRERWVSHTGTSRAPGARAAGLGNTIDEPHPEGGFVRRFEGARVFGWDRKELGRAGHVGSEPGVVGHDLASPRRTAWGAVSGRSCPGERSATVRQGLGGARTDRWSCRCCRSIAGSRPR